MCLKTHKCQAWDLNHIENMHVNILYLDRFFVNYSIAKKYDACLHETKKSFGAIIG